MGAGVCGVLQLCHVNPGMELCMVPALKQTFKYVPMYGTHHKKLTFVRTLPYLWYRP